MSHADEDVVCRSQTDDGTSNNDIKLISNADEEPAGGGVPTTPYYVWQAMH